jgi:hypothetical protein
MLGLVGLRAQEERIDRLAVLRQFGEICLRAAESRPDQSVEGGRAAGCEYSSDNRKPKRMGFSWVEMLRLIRAWAAIR